ncbi:MAG: nucleoside diphosphate kinase regulator [Chthoniobacterales bacterium]
MTPILFTLLAAGGVSLCALLIVATGLIHANLKRRTALAAGGAYLPSRILDDLRPVEDLLADFVGHSPKSADLLALLASFDQPASFARLVHEIRIGRNGTTDLKVAANLVGPTLFILGLAGLIRLQGEGFVATEVGREVRRRIVRASPASQQTTKTAIPAKDTPLAPARRKEHKQLTENLTATKESDTMSTRNRNIIITADDHAELEAVITFTGRVSARARVELSALERELKRADVVAAEEIPEDVITMNSRAELLDLDSRERMQFTLVLPRDARIEEGKISVLAPLGTAILGYRVGDKFQWRVPYGVRRLKVTGVSFQPEAALKQAA